MRKSSVPLFLHKSINVVTRSSWCISLHRPGPTFPHSNYFAIYLCINLAVCPTAPYRLSTIRLLHLCIPLPWSIGLSRRPFLCYISVSIHLSESLRGTWAQSNRSHHPIRVPLVHLWLYRQVYPSVSPCVSLTHRPLFWHTNAFCTTSVHLSLVCLSLSVCPSICLCLPQSKHIPACSGVFPRRCTNTAMFHLCQRAWQCSTASLPRQQKTVPFHYGAY